jgi:anti-anti-sigma regulatory factor
MLAHPLPNSIGVDARRSREMLRISETDSSSDDAILRLEGEITGPWIVEVQKACDRLLGSGGRLTLDLAEVSYIDRDAIRLFRDLAQRKVTLINCSAFLTEQLKQATF